MGIGDAISAFGVLDPLSGWQCQSDRPSDPIDLVQVVPANDGQVAPGLDFLAGVNDVRADGVVRAEGRRQRRV
jgi:hypothetical protein